MLAVSEACNNAIEHAYNGNGRGSVRLSARLDGDVLHLEIADRGHWIEASTSDERGRGLLLMRGLMDKVDVRVDAAGTRITLERRRRAVVADAVAANVAAPT